MTDFRDYAFLGTTQSLCPECHALVPAKIIDRDQRVYFRKTCPTHGLREDFVCSDRRWFDRLEYSLPGKLPPRMGVTPRLGCPYDCGLCTEHEQHTCVAILEITSSCNLECPLCYASSGPGGQHLSVEQCMRAMDQLIAAEGRPEVLQLSGGEPTIHPEFSRIFQAACARPIDIVMINTNGIRIARESDFVERLAEFRHRCEIYLQFDGFDDRVHGALRGASLTETKLAAIDRLGEAGLHTILVCTVQPGVNDDQVGRIVEYGAERPWVTGVNFQPATYVGRHVLPEELERRITFPDVLRRLEEQTHAWTEADFLPLPCAHPNAHTIAYAYRHADQLVPLQRFVDLARHTDLLANGITFTRGKAKALIDEFLARAACGSDCGCAAGAPQVDALTSYGWLAIRQGATAESMEPWAETAQSFFTRALKEELTSEDVFRVTTTSFMDAYNFDVRQLMKSCVHFVLPSGHLIPFSAYNLFYRDGRVPLPRLGRVAQVDPIAAKS